MESHKTTIPPPEDRQLKVVVVWWRVFVTLCLDVRNSILLSDLNPPCFFLYSLTLDWDFPFSVSHCLSLSFCSEPWQWGYQPQKDKLYKVLKLCTPWRFILRIMSLEHMRRGVGRAATGRM